jgi:DNA-binding CsgD family transcriptional regulator
MGEPEPGQVHQFNRCVLSDREAQVVRLLLTGHRVAWIARRLFISQSTVRNHLSTVFRKLRVDSQQELTLLFFALWRDGDTPPGVRQPRRLCLACRTPFWQEPEATG